MSENVDKLLLSHGFVCVYCKSSRVVNVFSYDKTGVTRVSAMGFKNVDDFSLSRKILFQTLCGIT